jgi:hypothetical protein
VPAHSDTTVVDAPGQAGHGRLDLVELVDNGGQVAGPGTPDERGARVVGGKAERVQVGGLDDYQPAGGPEAGQRRVVVHGQGHAMGEDDDRQVAARRRG